MAVNLSPVGGVAAQFFNNDGTVLSGGKLNTYTAGTTTPAVTYTTSAGNIAHSNPIVLNSAGRVPASGEVWLTDGITYKFVLTDANDVLIATYENISGINTNFVNFTNEQEIQTATAGQTVFTLTTMQYQPGTGSLSVFVDGVNQYGPGAQYAFTETSGTVVTFITGLHVGASVKFTTSAINAASYGNAFQISYTPPYTGSVATNVGLKLAQTVSVKDFGAVGDGVTDDTAAIQLAFNLAGQNGFGYITFPCAEYKVDGTILVPTNTYVDLNRSTLIGPGTGTDAMFESGYWNGSAMVTNIGTASLLHKLENVIFTDGKITNSPLALNLYNCLFGCRVQNIFFNGCDYAVYSNECFFAIFDNLTANISMTSPATAAFYFGNFSNAQTITNCYTTTRDLGFQFDGTGSAVRVIGCNADGGLNGIKVTGQIQALLVESCYFENLSQVGIDLNYTAVHQQIEISNNYFANVQTCVKGNVQNPADTNYVPTFIRYSNKFTSSCTFWYQTTDDVYTTGKVEFANDLLLVSNTAGNKIPAQPSYYVVGGKQSIDAEYCTYDNGNGEVTIKTKFFGDTITPLNYVGNAGTVIGGEVAFSNVAITGTSPTQNIVITTGIAYNQHTSIVVYNLNLFDAVNNYRVYGHIYGDTVVASDSSGKTLTISNVGGSLILTFAAFSGSPSVVGATGVVRHV